MQVTEQSMVGDIVAQNYLNAEVFRKYKIDFCCHGNRSIIEACEYDEMKARQVIADLNHLLNKEKNTILEYQLWPMDVLIEHIKNKHHKYVEEQIPIIRGYLTKICSAHGFKHPELFEVNLLFNQAADNLTSHMKKEELVLFPYICKIEEAVNSRQKIAPPFFGSVKTPIAMMQDEHEEEGDHFRRISELTKDYSVPEDACNTYRVSMLLLKQFEEDLFLHIHLENNILFPQSIRKEQDIK